MNNLLWILLLYCCKNNKQCDNTDYCRFQTDKKNCYETKEKTCCSLKERDEMWTPYMGNVSNADKDCGCEHTH